ncbi:SirB2 family protein [Pigmentiphaga soli]|uniref:SirB2 family protein n=1 Tax=Pigmentiphaga soli TaxID=1007095 RepID=A0ABP8H655_9BURK
MNGALLPAMAGLYLLLKMAHVSLALLSGLLFAGRGAAVLLGSAAPMAQPVRCFSQAIDTALLLAALSLLALLRLDPFVTPWLLAKLALLATYIVLGTLALRRAPTRAGKAAAFAAALLCFGMMIAIAHTHDPLGFLRVVGDGPRIGSLADDGSLH